MKKTQQTLWICFCLPLLLAAVIFVAGDIVHADMACWADADKQTLFVISTVTILVTLALIPLALRLFKFRRIHDDLLQRKAGALRKWGIVRIAMLGLLLVVNTVFYYAFAFESTFGYLAAITLLTFPFVMPTTNRCLAETSPEPEPEPEPDPEPKSDEQPEPQP